MTAWYALSVIAMAAVSSGFAAWLIIDMDKEAQDG